MPQRLVPVHPVALVGVVAGAEIDARDAVDRDHMAEQRGGQQGAGRRFQTVLDMRALVDDGGAALDRPLLRRDRRAPAPGEPNAEGAAPHPTPGYRWPQRGCGATRPRAARCSTTAAAGGG